MRAQLFSWQLGMGLGEKIPAVYHGGTLSTRNHYNKSMLV